MKTIIFCTIFSIIFGLQSRALADDAQKPQLTRFKFVGRIFSLKKNVNTRYMEVRPALNDQQKEDPNLIKLTWDDNEKPLKLPMDKTVEIRLAGNPTTGFQWQLVELKGKAVKEKQEVEYIADKFTPPRVGSGGVFVFRFMPVEVGKASIKLCHFRPWEKDTPPEKTFQIDVEVVKK